MAQRTKLAFLFLFTCPAMFSTNMLIARAVHDFFPPVALAFWRWFIVLLLVGITAAPALYRMRHDLIKEWKDLALLGALGMGVCGAFVYIGAQTTTATNVGLIYAASPILIVAMSVLFFAEPGSLRQVLGIALSFAGVLVVVCRGNFTVLTELNFAVGDLWIVAAMAGWAVYSVWLKYRPSRLPMQTRFMAICLFGVLILLPFYVGETIWYQAPALSWQTIAAVFVLGIVAGYGAYQTYGFVQAELGTGTASLIMYLIPIYNAGLAWVFLGEALQNYHLIGGGLVLPGVYLATVVKK